MTVDWSPDAQLIAAALSVHTPTATLARLSAPDRCCVVAGLDSAGLTTEDIAVRLGCSIRTVRTVRSDPMTVVCARMQAETAHFTDELRLARREHTARLRDLEETRRENDRLRSQIARLLGNTCRAGHPLTPYNTYLYRGRPRCRECHRKHARDYRARQHKVSPA